MSPYVLHRGVGVGMQVPRAHPLGLVRATTEAYRTATLYDAVRDEQLDRELSLIHI